MLDLMGAVAVRVWLVVLTWIYTITLCVTSLWMQLLHLLWIT